jgi:hypothetical protein
MSSKIPNICLIQKKKNTSYTGLPDTLTVHGVLVVRSVSVGQIGWCQQAIIYCRFIYDIGSIRLCSVYTCVSVECVSESISRVCYTTIAANMCK